jgi:hypothetical protein
MPPVQVHRCFTAEEGRRVEPEFTALTLDDSDFTGLGAALEATTHAALRQGRVGSGTSRAVRPRAVVDFSVGWLTTHRGRLCPKDICHRCPYSRPAPTMVLVPMGGKALEGDYDSAGPTGELRSGMSWTDK